MPNSAQILFALAMAVWVVDVRFANKPAPPPAISDSVSCQSDPIGQAPAGADLEVVVCTPRSK